MHIHAAHGSILFKQEPILEVMNLQQDTIWLPNCIQNFPHPLSPFSAAFETTFAASELQQVLTNLKHPPMKFPAKLKILAQ